MTATSEHWFKRLRIFDDYSGTVRIDFGDAGRDKQHEFLTTDELVKLGMFLVRLGGGQA